MMSSRKVRGIIFQFNPKAVLFEFQEGNEIDGIGVIHPHKVSTGQDVKDLIPSSATTADEIGKYIQVGDELDCTVKKMDNLEKVKFEEDGEVVEIQPEYSAEQAFKVGGRENKKVDSKFEVIDEIGEIEELEGQLDNMFDEDDVEVIMEVKKTKERGSRSPGRESRRKRSRSRGRRSRSRGRRTRSRGRRSRSKSRKTARSRSKEKKSDSVSGAGVKKDIKLNLTSTLAKVPSKPKVPELEHHPAKVVFISKNALKKGGRMQITSGRFEGRILNFFNTNLYVFGHHLRQASLMYNIKPDDEFKILIQGGDMELEIGDSGLVPNVEVAYLGLVGIKSPIKPDANEDFAKWLAKKSLDYDRFSRWISNAVTKRPYFPFPDEAHPAVITSVVKKFNPKGDGILAILKTGPYRDKEVFIERADFYFHGVSFGNCDFRMFVRPGEYVNLQVEHPISKSGKEKTLKFADVELELEVLLAYVGAKRPKSSSVKPGESPELKEFLEEKMCMTVEEFEKMKNSTGKEEEDQNGTDTKSKKGDDKSVKAKAAKTRTGGTSRFDPNPPAISDMFAAQAAAQKTNSAIMSGPATSLNRTVQASTLTARAMMLQGVHDAKLPHLLESDVDIENAIFLSKMFTTALLHKMQDQVLSKALEMKHGKQFINIVQGQKAQATKFEETINEGKRLMEDKKKRAIEAEKTEFNKKVDEQLRAVEESMREETRKRATKSLSTVGSSKKMKAMLESYKASKSKAQENTQNISPTQNVPSVEKEITRCYNETPQDLALEQTMSPLQLLRLYTVQNRKVTCENDKIYFGRLSFPKDTKTNFKVTRVNELEAQYYTMDALVNFLAHMHKSHSNYIRDSLRFENILIVRRQDRSYLEDYLTGKIDNCPNLVQLSHEQLNPEQTSLQRLGPVAPSAKVQENIAAKMDEWKIKNMTEKDYLKSVQPAQSETQAVHMMSLPTPAPIQKPPMMNQQAFVPLNQQQQPLNSMVQQGSFHGSEYGGGLPVPVNAMSSAQVGNWGEPLVQTGVGMMMPSRESVSSLRAMANSSKLTKPDDYSQREMDIERPLSPEWGGSKIDIGRSQSPMRKLQAKETRWIEEPELVGSWNTNSAELEATKKNRSFSPRHSYQPDDPTTSPKRRVSPARRSPSRRRPSPMRRSPPRRNVSPLRRSPLRRNVSPIRRSSPVRSAAPGRLPSPSQVSRRPSPPRLSSMSRPSFNMTSNSEKRSSAQEREIMPFRKDPNISNEFQKFRGEEERRHGSHLSDNQSLSREENNYQRSQQIEPSTRFSGSQVRNDSPEFRKSNQSPEPRYDLSSRNNRLPEPRRSEDIERPSRASRFDDLDANRSGSRFGLSNSGEQSRGVSVELLNAPETSARFRNTGDPRSQQIGNIMDRPGSRDLEDSRRETSFDSLRMRQSIANQDRPSRDFPQSQDASGYQGSSYPSQRPGNDFGSSRDDNSYAPHHRDKDLGSQRDGSQKGEHRFGLTPGDSMGPSQGRDLFRPSQGGNTQGPSLGGNNFGQPSAGDHVPPQGGNYGGPQVGDYGTPKGANNFGSQQGGENFGFSQGGNNFGQPQGGGNLGGRDDQQRVSRFDQGPSYGQSDFGGGNSMSGNFNQGAQPGFQSDFGAGAPPTRQW